MIHRSKSAIIFYRQAKRIIDRLTVDKPSGFLQLVHQVFVPNMRFIEVTIPDGKVLDGRKQTGSAYISIGKNVVFEAAVAVRFVGIGAVLDYFFFIRVELGILHTQRLEYTF